MNTKSFLSLVFLFLSLAASSFAQDDIRVGTSRADFYRGQGGLYDYSDPKTINITIIVWGFVKYPGQYIIPVYSNINNLLALAGGPTEDADLEDLRIFRINKDSSQSMIKFDYNDLLWEDELTKHIEMPEIKAGDILLVPGEPRFYFKDYFSLVTSVIGTAVSIAILLITIFK